MATGTSIAFDNPQLPEIPKELLTDALPLEEQIRRRAHEIWLERNGEGGSATEDWLQAEEEIRLELRGRVMSRICLIVDDETMIRDYLKCILHGRHLETREAAYSGACE